MFATSQSLVQTPPNPPGGGVVAGDGDTPRNPFSISVILSDEVGQKRSPPSNSATPQSFPSTSATPLSRNERPRRPSQENTAERSSNSHSIGQLFHTPSRSTHQSGGGMWGQRIARPSRVTSAEATNTTKSPSTNTGLLNVPGILSKGSSGSQKARLTPSHPHSHNSSITASPFNADILQALGHQQMTTPTNNSVDILDDSLGMLSTVALLDSEMSDVNTSAGTSVQERLAGMKITSHHDASMSSHDEDVPRPVYQESSMVGPSPSRKSHTPHILKRDRRRQRKKSGTDFSKMSGSNGSVAEDQTHLNTGFLSPLAADHTRSKQQFTFSPSIFLSRPGDDSSSNPSPQRARPTSLHPPPHQQEGGNHSAPVISAANFPIGTLSPSSESDGVGEEFVTSTPIKTDKENMHGAHRGTDGGGGVAGGAWSPSILQTSSGTRRHFLKETNDASSGSDSELPVKKLKTTPLAHPHQHKRRKSKARTKLSPLLENACSPIAKADHTHQPSPLVTSVTSTAPSQTLSLSPPPHTQAPSTSSATIGQLRPSITAESAQPQAPPIAPPTPSYSASASGIPQLAANLVLSQGQHHQQHQANVLPHQSMATVYPMLQKTVAVPNQTTLLSPQATLINPALSYPFNPMVPAFGGFIPMQSYATSPVCLPGFLPGMSSFYNPQVHPAQPVYPTNLSSSVNLMGNTSSLVAPKYGKWGGSMCSSPQQASSSQRNHLQSVPPWFIFSDKRADSKRSRMTEAINKSLSETPSQKTKLPAEWSKYACGQTADQKALTEEARSFLLLRPRQLHFDEES